jgi:hypothetical protein
LCLLNSSFLSLFVCQQQGDGNWCPHSISTSVTIVFSSRQVCASVDGKEIFANLQVRDLDTGCLDESKIFVSYVGLECNAQV